MEPIDPNDTYTVSADEVYTMVKEYMTFEDICPTENPDMGKASEVKYSNNVVDFFKEKERLLGYK